MSSVFIYLLSIVVIIVISITIYVKNVFSYWKRQSIPYAKPTFPFGNFKKVFTDELPATDMVVQLYNSTTEPIVGVFMTINPMLMIRDPKIIRNILVKDFASFSHRATDVDEKADPMMNNLLFQNGEKWKQNRVKLTPAFTSAKLKEMFNTIVDCGKSLDKYIEKFAKSGETIEIHEVFARFGTNVIASLGFGIEIDCIEDPDIDFRRYGRRTFEPRLINSIRLNLHFIFPKLARLLRLRFSDKDVGEFFIEIVRKCLAHREKNNLVCKDFLQLLMQVRNTGQVRQDDGDWSAKSTSTEKQMSIEEMTAHAFVFLLGSYESSSTTMAFCMYEMAKRPETQNKAYEEIEKVLAKHDGKLTYESIGEMKYLNSCIHETLRLHAPFGYTTRRCMSDYELPELNVVIEKGTPLIIPNISLHYDPQYFELPTQFRPERFDENVKFSVDKPFMPFGLGPRTCIAYRLANLKTKIAIVLMLRKFKFELDAQHINKPLKIDHRAVARMAMGGINLKVNYR